MDYQYIDSPGQLAGVVSACKQVDVLAIDTEFIRVSTYYPIVGLVQIYNGQECFIIDPVTVDLSFLAPILTAPEITKIFHACSEDLEVFQHTLRIHPAPVFDTQIAAAVLGVGFSMSYQNLVNYYMGITVPKGETRSDWLQRPLTRGQIEYAALDVIYLYQVYQLQKKCLLEQGRLAWVEEECQQMGVDNAITMDPNDFYKRLKSAQRLKPRELNVLRALCSWREVMARRQDAPRNRIVDQKSLIAMVKQQPRNKEELIDIGFSPRQVRKYGEQLLSVTAEALAAPEDGYPEQMILKNKSVDSQKLKYLREMADRRAGEISVCPELLIKQRHLKELMQSGKLPDGLKGWREEAVGKFLMEAARTWR